MNERPIKPEMHMLLDFALAVLLLIMPSLGGFPPRASTLAYWLAGVVALLAALTVTRVGLAKLIPLRTHGLLEWVLMPGIIIIAPMTGAMHTAAPRFFFIMFTLVVAMLHGASEFGGADAKGER